VDEQLVGCENFVEERKGENVREQARRRAKDELGAGTEYDTR